MNSRNLKENRQLFWLSGKIEENSLISDFCFPKEIMNTVLSLTIESTFPLALHHCAHGCLEELKQMLEQEPLLVLCRGEIITPGGLVVKNISLLECALLSGDRQLAEMILIYFDKFKGGCEARDYQLERCRPIIENLSSQEAEDLTSLFDIIQNSPLVDVIAELKKGKDYDVNYSSKLRDALNEFRKHKLNSNRIVNELRMFCNYQNILHADALLSARWNSLKVKNDFSKHFLIKQQIIGLIELLEFTPYYRYVYAGAQVNDAIEGNDIKRSTQYENGEGSFPCFDAVSFEQRSGVGFDSYVSLNGMLAGKGISGGSGAGGVELQKLHQANMTSLQDLYLNLHSKKSHVNEDPEINRCIFRQPMAC